MNPRTLQAGKQLKPSEVYCAAIGMFEASGYELIDIIGVEAIHGWPGQITEKARVYRRGGQYHILYYPGKDHELSTHSIETEPLSHIIGFVNDELKRKTYFSEIAGAKKHFIVAENNKYLVKRVKHYIYAATDETGLLTTEDSIDRDYDLRPLYKIIPFNKPNPPIKRGWQSMIKKGNDWQCGHFALQALMRDIKQIPAPVKPNVLVIDEAMIDRHNDWYDRGNAQVMRTPIPAVEPQSYNKKDDFSMDDDEPAAIGKKRGSLDHSDDDFSMDDSDQDDLLPAPRSSQRKSNIGEKEKHLHRSSFADEQRPLIGREENRPGFFKRHPWVKWALIGAGIGLAVAGFVVLGMFTFGALPLAVGAAAAIGSAVGLTGAAATGVGFAAMTVGTAVAFGAGAGMIGKIKNRHNSETLMTEEAIAASRRKESQTGIRRRLSDSSDSFIAEPDLSIAAAHLPPNPAPLLHPAHPAATPASHATKPDHTHKRHKKNTKKK